jgi:hypothetical protein
MAGGEIGIEKGTPVEVEAGPDMMVGNGLGEVVLGLKIEIIEEITRVMENKVAEEKHHYIGMSLPLDLSMLHQSNSKRCKHLVKYLLRCVPKLLKLLWQLLVQQLQDKPADCTLEIYHLVLAKKK